jgi:hypothetical protein
VVSAVKFGASELIRNDITPLLIVRLRRVRASESSTARLIGLQTKLCSFAAHLRHRCPTMPVLHSNRAVVLISERSDIEPSSCYESNRLPVRRCDGLVSRPSRRQQEVMSCQPLREEAQKGLRSV